MPTRQTAAAIARAERESCARWLEALADDIDEANLIAASACRLAARGLRHKRLTTTRVRKSEGP